MRSSSMTLNCMCTEFTRVSGVNPVVVAASYRSGADALGQWRRPSSATCRASIDSTIVGTAQPPSPFIARFLYSIDYSFSESGHGSGGGGPTNAASWFEAVVVGVRHCEMALAPYCFDRCRRATCLVWLRQLRQTVGSDSRPRDVLDLIFLLVALQCQLHVWLLSSGLFLSQIQNNVSQPRSSDLLYHHCVDRPQGTAVKLEYGKASSSFSTRCVPELITVYCQSFRVTWS